MAIDKNGAVSFDFDIPPQYRQQPWLLVGGPRGGTRRVRGGYASASVAHNTARAFLNTPIFAGWRLAIVRNPHTA